MVVVMVASLVDPMVVKWAACWAVWMADRTVEQLAVLTVDKMAVNSAEKKVVLLAA